MCLANFQKAVKALNKIGRSGISLEKIKYYQTENAMETVCIIEDTDAISIGFARAGKYDLESGLITEQGGMDVAEGRARKARVLKTALIEKNYLRAIYAPKVKV